MTETNEPLRSYTFGINVERAEELDVISAKIRDFISTVGDGPSEIQVAVNPGLGESSAPEQLAPAIGFVYEGDAEDYYEEEDEE